MSSPTISGWLQALATCSTDLPHSAFILRNRFAAVVRATAPAAGDDDEDDDDGDGDPRPEPFPPDLAAATDLRLVEILLIGGSEQRSVPVESVEQDLRHAAQPGNGYPVASSSCDLRSHVSLIPSDCEEICVDTSSAHDDFELLSRDGCPAMVLWSISRAASSSPARILAQMSQHWHREGRPKA